MKDRRPSQTDSSSEVFTRRIRTAALALAALAASFGTSTRAAAAEQDKGASGDTTSGPRHLLYLEAGGAALLGSVNYELEPAPGLGLRAGFGAVPVCPIRLHVDDGTSPNDTRDTSCGGLPISTLGASYSALSGSHHPEVGALYTWAWADDNDARFVVPSVGYRYQRPGGGFLFRAAFTPFVRINSGDVLPWGGLSFGYSFS